MDLNSVSDEVNKYIPVWKIRQLAESATNYVMNYTEPESKVREATNEDAWGPTGPILAELVRYTNMYTCFGEVMGMLWTRMCQDNQGAWRRVYKSLLVLDHLIKNGSDRCVNSAKDHLYDVRSLQHYQCIDNKGKDQGLNIRHRAKEIISMLSDDEKIREARATAKKNAQKFSGSGGSVGNYGGSSSYGVSGGGYGCNSYDSYGGDSSNYNNNNDRSGGYSDNAPSAGQSRYTDRSSKTKSGGGLGGWDGQEDNDDGTGGTVHDENKDSANPNEIATDFDWTSAPSGGSASAPRRPSFDQVSQESVGSAQNKQKKSVPRKLVSLGAAAKLGGGAGGSSGNAASNTPSSNFDLLGGLTTTQPATSTNTTTGNSNSGDWDPFAAAGVGSTNPAAASANGLGAPTPSNTPAPKSNQSNDPFSDFFGSGKPQTQIQTQNINNNSNANNSLNDFFGSGTQNTNTMQPSSNHTINNNNNQNSSQNMNNLNDLFGGLSATSANQTSQNNKMSASSSINFGSSNQNNNSSVVKNKISSSSTWGGIDNLDSLVNMGAGSSKPKQSMNSMMSKPAPQMTAATNFATFSSAPMTPSSNVMTPSSSVMTPSSTVMAPNSAGAAKKTSNDNQFMGFL